MQNYIKLTNNLKSIAEYLQKEYNNKDQLLKVNI